ncbi:DNA polymerase Y family protein [Catenulispora yoronensis]
MRRGQRVRDAQRLAPGLVVHARDEAAEARAFEPVLGVLAEYTPRFEVVRPGLAALPMDAPARYFGGEDLVVRGIRDRIGELGVGAGVGVADGVFAAALAARSDTRVVAGRTAEFLAAFPVPVLELPELDEPLARLGVRTLGRLAELPADAVAGRFGAAGVAAHRLARGLDARPPAPLRQGPDLTVETVFDPPADGSERIVFAAKALADELHAVLAQSGVACVRVAVEIHGTAGAAGVSGAAGAAGAAGAPEVSYRLWRHEGLLSSTAVAERVRWQLSGWQIQLQRNSTEHPADHPADQGITRLRLIPDHLTPALGVQPGLWGADEAPDRIARAAERLQAMYGPNAVTLPADRGGRTPGPGCPHSLRRSAAGSGRGRALAGRAARPGPGRRPPPAPPGRRHRPDRRPGRGLRAAPGLRAAGR